ncbi:MAG: hypothetical protein ABI862_16205 [Ilumatobacteraceae bacterium]
MNHRHHLICLGAAVLAITLLLLAGSSNLAVVGISAVLLVSPILMGGVMWLLMRPSPQQRTDRQQLPSAHHVNAARR